MTSKRPPTMSELAAHKDKAKPKLVEKLEVGELTPMGKPDAIPADVWALVQDNGRIATEKLNEILRSPRFDRMRASDQVKFIKLAQERAYGAVAATQQTKGVTIDITAQELGKLARRAELPEYQQPQRTSSNDIVHEEHEDVGDRAGEPDDPDGED